MFDIHKVKPVHGWREFIGEVGIIVLGVLIALGAEQIIERLHWNHKVSAAEEALKPELTGAYLSAAERIIEAPCLDAQLDILKARVLSSPGTLVPAPVIKSPMGTLVYRYPSRTWDDTIWQSIIGEQVSSHFDREQRQQLAFAYNSIGVLRRLNDEEVSSGGTMMAMGAPLPLDPSLRGHFIEMIEAERQRTNFMALVADQVMEAERTAMPDLPQALHDPRWKAELHSSGSTVAYCQAHHLPLTPAPTA